MNPTPCLCTQIRRAARALTNRYDAALAPSGITVAQFSLMRNVSRLSEPHLSALAAATGLERSTIGRNLRLLAAAGLVRLEAGTDRRVKVARLTAVGSAVIEEALPRWQHVQDEVEQQFGSERRRQLFDLLIEAERLEDMEACAADRAASPQDDPSRRHNQE